MTISASIRTALHQFRTEGTRQILSLLAGILVSSLLLGMLIAVGVDAIAPGTSVATVVFRVIRPVANGPSSARSLEYNGRHPTSYN